LEAQLPCDGFVEKFEQLKKVRGCYHHINGEEANKFVKILQNKLRAWGSKCDQCSQMRKSARSVIKSSCSGRGQISFTPQMVGPFLD